MGNGYQSKNPRRAPARHFRPDGSSNAIIHNKVNDNHKTIMNLLEKIDLKLDKILKEKVK